MLINWTWTLKTDICAAWGYCSLHDFLSHVTVSGTLSRDVSASSTHTMARTKQSAKRSSGAPATRATLHKGLPKSAGPAPAPKDPTLLLVSAVSPSMLIMLIRRSVYSTCRRHRGK